MAIHKTGGGLFAFSDFYEGLVVPPPDDGLMAYMPQKKQIDTTEDKEGDNEKCAQ